MPDRQPTRLQRRLDELFPGYRYGVVLVLLFTTYVFMASGPTHVVARVVTVALMGATLLTTLIASRSDWRLFRLAAVVVAVALGAAFASAFVSSSTTSTNAFFALNALLVGACPVVIARALLRRRSIDVHTVLGAICIYVLIGMIFAFVYATSGILDQDFFVQTRHATLPDFLYFSFVTQTTVGFGDFTAAGGLGALAAFEGMVGQLYLVTVVAVLVSNVSRTRRRRGVDDSTPETDAGSP